MNQDVFEGTKAYEEFVKNGVRWFEEEQKLFEKNMELIHEALRRTGEDGEHIATIKDIYELETELKMAIVKHSELLNACTSLQIMADEMISGAKFRRLRRNFDFNDALKVAMSNNRADLLGALVEPLLKLNTKKRFSLCQVDKMLSLPLEKGDVVETISEHTEETMYVYADEEEEIRIEENYRNIMILLLIALKEFREFDLRFFCEYLDMKLSKKALQNSDFYSMLVHMSQKKTYNIDDIRKSPDTFFEKHMAKAIEKKDEFDGMVFEIEFVNEDEIQIAGIAKISNIKFKMS